MEFTESEQTRLTKRTRDRLEQAIAAVVEWSFEVRPMVQRTDAERDRRQGACLDLWREQVSHDIEILVAAQNLPMLLVAYLDHDAGGDRSKSIIEHVDFPSGMFPSMRDQQRLIVPELALTALARKG